MSADTSRYVPNYLPDPPVISTVAILDPESREVLLDRFVGGFGEVTRRVDPVSRDTTVYTGPPGIGLVALHIALHQSTTEEREDYLRVAENYIRGAKETYERRHRREDVTFIMGSPGIYSQLAVLERELGNQGAMEQAIRDVLAVEKKVVEGNYPFELLYGATGYLYALLFLKTHIPTAVSDEVILRVVDHIMANAENGPRGEMIFYWHDTLYLGGAHGLSGICLTLLDACKFVTLPDNYLERIRSTVDYIIQTKWPGGNYPSSVGSERDRLVQFCHGAPGILLMLLRAYEVLASPRYLALAEEAADVVWKRGLLRKGNGLCHGVSGNAYCFLSLYRVTDNERYFNRAAKFALFAEDPTLTKEQATPDHPWSLFEGHAGLVLLYFDLLHNPKGAKFPAVEV